VKRAWLAAVFAAVPALPCGAEFAGNAMARPGQWVFEVSLDGSRIGYHRFTLSTADGSPDARRLAEEAEFKARFLGIPVYRYHHEVQERWEGSCLASLSASTDDDGRATQVQAERNGGFTRITTRRGQEPQTQILPGCIMSYAYWNPALRAQANLLNPQTGRLDPVAITREGAAQIMAYGRPVAADDWRIRTPDGSIDVWYSATGDWLGLDAVVSGRRKLSYRLP